MPVVLPSDVSTLQSAIRTQAAALQAAFETCRIADKIRDDDPDRDAFAQLLRRVSDYLNVDPSILDTAAQMDAGEALQRDMAPWYQRLKDKACQPPPQPEVKSQTAPLMAGLGDMSELVKWGVILYVATQALPLLTGGQRRRR